MGLLKLLTSLDVLQLDLAFALGNDSSSLSELVSFELSLSHLEISFKLRESLLIFALQLILTGLFLALQFALPPLEIGHRVDRGIIELPLLAAVRLVGKIQMIDWSIIDKGCVIGNSKGGGGCSRLC